MSEILSLIPSDLILSYSGHRRNSQAQILRGDALWKEPLAAFDSLVKLKKWYRKMHKRYPEFDQVLFGGTKLFAARATKKE